MHAKAVYEKLGDDTKLMALFLRKAMWSEAVILAQKQQGLIDEVHKESVFMPYAEWLISQDRFPEALDAYKKAGRYDLHKAMLKELTHNAIVERR
jgi:intraflagellar transport protein 122